MLKNPLSRAIMAACVCCLVSVCVFAQARNSALDRQRTQLLAANREAVEAFKRMSVIRNAYVKAVEAAKATTPPATLKKHEETIQKSLPVVVEVRRAQWGVPGKVVDVTKIVQAYFAKTGTISTYSRKTKYPDPAFGVRKSLSLELFFNGAAMQLELPSDTVLRLGNAP